MKNISQLIAALMLSATIAHAQSTEVALNTTTKTQEQKMEEFNTRTGVNMKLYPNPAVNYLVVEPELRNEAGEIRIMDISGRVKTGLYFEPGTNGLTIDVADFTNGLYILALYDKHENLLHISRFYKN